MKSLKAVLLAAIAAMVVVAVVAPAVASASSWLKYGTPITTNDYQEHLVWSKNNVPLKEADSFNMSGNFVLHGELGTLECTVSATVALQGNSGSGTMTKFEVPEPSKCKSSGLIKSLAGDHGLNSATANGLPWTVSTSGTDANRKIAISDFDVTYNVNYQEKSNLPVTFTGDLIATPIVSVPNYDAEEIGSIALEGTVMESLFEDEMEVKSTQTLASEALEVFGIFNLGTSSVNAAVSGTLGWSNEYGSMNCPVSGNVALRSGSTAYVTSLVWDTAKCTLSGTVSKCAPLKRVASKLLPWPAVTEADGTISITEFPVKAKFAGGCNSDMWTGSLTATPNNHVGISSTSLSGTLLMAEEISAGWSGTLNWSPANTYGF
ncbi:MAG TPA: hypothetical protein VMR96_02245 [Solirubrobacterales bacterium]|nr:hypothetical protein [Solirubrobacterales bacterium]